MHLASPGGPTHPPNPALAPGDLARWQKARQHIAAGRAEQALPAYLTLVKRFPTVAGLWFECGLAALGSLDFDAAKRSFRQARDLAPADVNLLVALGQQYHRLRQQDLARESFEAAAKADPSSLHASLSLAAWLERERNLEAAWQLAEETLARHPNEAAAQYYRAFLLQRKGRAAEAEPLLREIVNKNLSDPNLRISCRHLLAVVLDELGQYDEALVWLLDSKNETRRAANVAALEQTYDRGDRARRVLLAALTPEMMRRWREETPPSAMPAALALLGGHPRSGTTLLEQILGVHPGIWACDESEAFAGEIWDQLSPGQAPASSASELHALSPSRCSALRARYFKSLLREMERPSAGQVLIDKNPGSTAALHFWLRLFPASKIIIALRDPRDVIVSCLFQQLTLTPINVNFLSAERAARHYSDLMDVWLRLRDLGGFDWMESRYEDVVTNLEREGRRVTEFLGLEWHPDQARGHEAARKKLVFSPTYADVAKPAYHRAVGRWKNYEAALTAVQPRLATYCQRFGY